MLFNWTSNFQQLMSSKYQLSFHKIPPLKPVPNQIFQHDTLKPHFFCSILRKETFLRTNSPLLIRSSDGFYVRFTTYKPTSQALVEVSSKFWQFTNAWNVFQQEVPFQRQNKPRTRTYCIYNRPLQFQKCTTQITKRDWILD